MSTFEMLALGFVAVALVNLALYRRKGPRALGLAACALLAGGACYVWGEAGSSARYWLLAAAVGMFLATALYESGKRRLQR